VPTDDAILVNRSVDGGQSWAPPVTVAHSHGAKLLDKEWLAVDTGAASPHVGTLYVAWTQIDNGVQPAALRAFIARSVDGGLNWTSPVKVSGTDRGAAGQIVLVGPNGELAVAYLHFSTRSRRQEIRVVRSGDGGDRWSAPVQAARYRPGKVRGIRADFGLAAAAEPSSGAMYLSWQQAGKLGDASDIATARSMDGGRHWSQPVRVPDRGRDTPQFTPTIAASGHRLDALFYEWLGSHRPRRYAVSFARSSDAGRRFGRPVRVSARFDPRNAARSDRGRFFGDYAGLVATKSFDQALWVDSRNPPRSSGPKGGNDVFTARIRARPHPIRR